MAIVGVYARGFEGLDHRFIAVPFMLKAGFRTRDQSADLLIRPPLSVEGVTR